MLNHVEALGDRRGSVEQFEVGACRKQFAFQPFGGKPVLARQNRHHVPARRQAVLESAVGGPQRPLRAIPGHRAGQSALHPQPKPRHWQMIRERADGERALTHPLSPSTDLEKPRGETEPFVGAKRGSIRQG